MKTVTSKSGRKYKMVPGRGWVQVKGFKPKKFGPHPRADVVAARVRMVSQARDRNQIAALIRRFRAADRNG